MLGGALGLSVFVAALATAGMFFVYKMCEGSAYMRAFVLILGAATAAVFWSPRPQMFSFFLSAVVLYILYLYRPRRVLDRLHLYGWRHCGRSAWQNLQPQRRIPDVARYPQARHHQYSFRRCACHQSLWAANAARAVPDGQYRRAARLHSGVELA
jgi:hypothetical protein